MKKLTKAQARELSGDAADTSRSLDDTRSWLSTDCVECGTTAVLEQPSPELNEVGTVADVMATLPDGSEVPVPSHPVAQPATTLRFTCGSCGRTQDAPL